MSPLPAARSEPIRIGTRSSELALRQAQLVQQALERRGVGSTLTTYETIGDKRPNSPLSAIGAQGLFTKELEDDLLAGHADCAVHSLKDLATQMPAGLVVVAVLARADPRDALVVHAAVRARFREVTLAALDPGTRVGTSSLRRRAQLRALRPDLDVRELRGNVPTRLRKVDAGEVDAAILAAAGLHRLEAQGRIARYLDAPAWLPAPGQGAIALQVRSDDERMRTLLGALNDDATMVATRAERAMLAALEGGCQVPIGALMTTAGGVSTLHGLVASVDGVDVVRGSTAVATSDPEAAGRRLAEELLERGGRDILRDLRRASQVPVPQPE